MKKIEISLLIALVFCAVVSFCGLDRECSDIRGKVLRMHIIAQSDALSDQELKLRVRDRVLESTGELFAGCSDRSDAIKAARENIGLIEQAARDEIARSGLDYPVSVEIADSWFSTRHYGDITLPAGTYTAVQIKIGEAKGHNWWCVMFPAMCVPGARGGEELDTVLDEQQMEIVHAQGYDVRLRCVELYEELVQRIKDGTC